LRSAIISFFVAKLLPILISPPFRISNCQSKTPTL
jgi:hypothetical protein